MKNNQELLDPSEIGTLKRPKTPTKKKEYNVKKTITWTVITTLAIVAAFIATFIGGMNYNESLHNQRNEAVKAATADLKDATPQK